MSIGHALVSFGSNLMAGPLGVVQLGFAGYDLGKTTENTVLKPDLNIKEIMYQQNGTKAADEVVNGARWIITATLANISTELLSIVASHLVKTSGAVDADSGVLVGELFKSRRETNGGVVKVAAFVDHAPSEELEDTMMFYDGVININSDLIQWGADQQRNLPIEIHLYPKELTAVESTTYKEAYGYWGDPTAEDLPAAVWPVIA